MRCRGCVPDRYGPLRLILAVALVATACGEGGEGAANGGSDPPATDPPAGHPGIPLTTLLARAEERGPGGDLIVLGDLGSPRETEREPVRNRHDPSQTDTIVTLRYQGLDVTLYHVTASGRAMIQTVRVTDESYETDEGLRVDLSRQRIRDVLGEPERTENDTWIYEVPGSPNDPTPMMLHVDFEGDSVDALIWHLYVD